MHEKQLDTILPFFFKNEDFRGRVIKTISTLDDILSQHNYPTHIANLLSETVILSILIASTITESQLSKTSLQIQSDGIISLLIADFNGGSNSRAYAKFDQAAYDSLIKTNPEPNFKDLLGQGNLILIAENNQDQYQSVISLDGKSLTECVMNYFNHSEQIMTFLKVAVGECIIDNKKRYRGGGIIIQTLPAKNQEHIQDSWQDLWNEINFLSNTIKDDELIDPMISHKELLYRLFHEHEVQTGDYQFIRHLCKCSRERVAEVLRSVPKEELETAKIDGKIEIFCQFCNKIEQFSDEDF